MPRIAGGRVDGLSASLEQLKKQATSTNGQDVQLRALEREAKAQRDLLESYLAKYREANTRENIDAGPADGRIISRAIVSNTPAYPKKLPIVLIATACDVAAHRRPDRDRRTVAHDSAARHRCARIASPTGDCARRPVHRPPKPASSMAEPAPESESEPVFRRTAERSRRGSPKSNSSPKSCASAGAGGAQGHRARHCAGREHHADGADAGATDGAIARKSWWSICRRPRRRCRRCRPMHRRRGLRN